MGKQKQQLLDQYGDPIPSAADKPSDMVQNVVVHLKNGNFVACGDGYAAKLNTTEDPNKVTCKECKRFA